MSDLVTVTIDGREMQVPKGTLVIRAAEELGITIPRFCDHPLLDPVGACRQCLVEVEGQRKPFASCTTTCTDGMVVKTHITSDFARDAQEGNLELLLVNHPLDCPQCDKGGECPLQDQALAHGPSDSRFVDEKRRYQKPIPISALVALDRERCVLCARCTRFSSEISGDPFIELFERGALEQVAIYEDEPYESYFSGNVVQICPVGALTSATYRFKSRPFDLRSHPTVCNQCSAGCNLRADVRRGEVQRQLARENMAVNEMWNCDRGRFGYEYIAHPERLRTPVARNELGSPEPASWLTALRSAAERLTAALDSGGPAAVGVITGGRLTDEDAYAVSRFARDVVGTDNVDFRLAPRTEEEVDVFGAVAGTMGPTYEDVEAAPVVVIAGLDPEEEVPILYLRLRKAWRRKGQRVVVVGPALGSLEQIAWRWVRTPAGGEAAALQALAAGDAGDDRVLTEAQSAVREAGDKLVVLAGERLSRSGGALRSAAALATGAGGSFAWVPRRTNARGAVDAGLVPGLLPGGRRLDDAGPVAEAWNRLPEAPGMDTRQMLEAAAAGELKALYLIGVDPIRDFEDPRLARAALEAVDSIIVQDVLPNATTPFADVILPAMVSQERIGSFTTWEGRRQPFPAAVPAQGLAQHDWDIVRQLAMAMESNLGWESANDVRREAAPLMEAAGTAADRLRAIAPVEPGQPAPHGDDFAVIVVDGLLDDSTMLVGAKALRETARPATVTINEADARRLDVTDGRHVAIIGHATSFELPARVSAGVVPGCVVLPGPASGVHAGALAEQGGPLRVRLEAADGFTDLTAHDPAVQVSGAVAGGAA